MKSPPFVGVVIAASTGGPGALMEVFNLLPRPSQATFFVAQHGPAWMVARRLKRKFSTMKVSLALDGVRATPGSIYMAPANRHLLIEPDSLNLRLADTPSEGLLYPSADILLRSAAEAFGRRCIAVVMTGMGRDGALGAAAVSAAGGLVIAQDPKTACAPSMPRTAIRLGVVNRVVPLAHLAATVSHYLNILCASIEIQKPAGSSGPGADALPARSRQLEKTLPWGQKLAP